MATKTREQLRLEGTELEGIILPDWFKESCDGCSIGKAKHLGVLAELRSACRIHDAEYTIIPIVYEIKTKPAKKARKRADKRLFRNVKTIIGARGKRPVRKFMLSRIAYGIVRSCGRWAVVPVRKKAERMPRTEAQYEELCEMIDEYILRHGINLDIFFAYDERLTAIRKEYVK